MTPFQSAYHRRLVELCESVRTLGPSVHEEILARIGEDGVTRNANGAFFDLAELDDRRLEAVESAVAYAQSTQGYLRQHELVMFENVQNLMSGPIAPADVAARDARGGAADADADAAAAAAAARCEGEEAFCVRMDACCAPKPAKGVFVRK